MWITVLRGVHLEQRSSKTSGIDPVTEFFHIESERDEEKLCFGFEFSSCKKSLEAEVLLDYAERSFDLNGTVHSEHYAFIGGNKLIRSAVLFVQLVRNLDLSVPVRGMTFAFVQTSLTRFAFVNLASRFITVVGLVFPCGKVPQLPSPGTRIFVGFGVLLHMFRPE